jgi:GTP-binding protein
MLSSLDARCQASSGLKFTIQSVITKLDAVAPGKINNVKTVLPQQIFDVAPTCLPPIFTSAKFSPAFGIDNLRKSIIEACGLGQTKVGTL